MITVVHRLIYHATKEPRARLLWLFPSHYAAEHAWRDTPGDYFAAAGVRAAHHQLEWHFPNGSVLEFGKTDDADRYASVDFHVVALAPDVEWDAAEAIVRRTSMRGGIVLSGP